jgi:hypothetical protein
MVRLQTIKGYGAGALCRTQAVAITLPRLLNFTWLKSMNRTVCGSRQALSLSTGALAIEAVPLIINKSLL